LSETIPSQANGCEVGCCGVEAGEVVFEGVDDLPLLVKVGEP